MQLNHESKLRDKILKSECFVLTMKVNITSCEKALHNVFKLLEKGSSAYICVSNVHMCMEAFDSVAFRKVVNNADIVLPDGRPIFWAQRLLNNSNAKQVRGQDIMSAICKQSGARALNIGLYGGSSDEILQQVIQKLRSNYDDICITYFYSPPFRELTEEEDAEVISDIRRKKVDILFVGIGCPKQELWMAEHKDSLNCVMLGVGAAFDFIGGSKKHAPGIIQYLGLEWLFRLCCEPSRLWKRYLRQNPRFILLFLKQLLNKRSTL